MNPVNSLKNAWPAAFCSSMVSLYTSVCIPFSTRAASNALDAALTSTSSDILKRYCVTGIGKGAVSSIRLLEPIILNASAWTLSTTPITLMVTSTPVNGSLTSREAASMLDES